MQVLGTRAQPPTGLISWFSKTEGNTYATLLHHPFLFKEIQRSAQEVARRFLAPLLGSVRKSQHTKYPSQSLSPALHYLPFASCFPLPHFTLAVLCTLFSFRPLLPFAFSCFRLFACVLDCLLVTMA